ncbi:MAG: prenyltransferase [Caldilineaceae bacterium]|nr:prenyltransferase [Caldilineaceae bacterium]
MTEQASGQITEKPRTIINAQQAQADRTPRTMTSAVIAVLRFDGALVLTLPAILGCVFGWWMTGRFDWLAFLFVVGGVFSSALAYQALSAFYDYEQSKSLDARPASDLPASPFALQQNGLLPPTLLLNVGALLLLIGALCAFWLALLTGWPMLFFSGMSFLLLAGALIPPVRYAYRGWGLGETGLFLSFGLLPLLGGYYSQTQSLSWLPLVAGWPLALLSLLAPLNQNLATFRRDWRIGKRTLAVILGPAHALDLNAAVTMAAYAGILIVTVIARLPLWYLVGLGTSPLAMGVYSGIKRTDVSVDDGYRLRDAAIKAAVWTAVLIVAALLISRPG